MSSKLKIFTDGGSRGNPGPAAVAFIILSEDGKVFKSHSRNLGIRTNNQAEYAALITALTYAKRIGAEEAICYSDSQLIVKQLTGEYRVKNKALKVLWRQVHNLKASFKNVDFIYAPRTSQYIELVDKLVNKSLDSSG
ncbi:ribonuclease HI family protein [Candidatus Bathyarchaeota archaeon]|nr:ribonuclease HI family protein [Candidatus Bathyarchaeota archaeon]